MSGPPGMTPPPDGDVYLGDRILALTWVEAVLATGFLGARLYTRSKIVKNIGWDDWTMLFAWVLSIVTSIFVTLEVHFGVGRHAYYITEENMVQATKMVWMTQPFSTFSACFGKISVALLLLRIMNRNRLQEIFLWFIIVTLLIANLGCVIITFAQCTPVWALWNRGAGVCWNPYIQLDSGYFQAAYSSFADLVLALFPILIIWNLQMAPKVKVGLAALMSLGIFATAAAIVKTALLGDLAQFDFTFATVDLVCWYTTENYVVIIAGCIPTLKPLFTQFSGTFSGSKASQYGGFKNSAYSGGTGRSSRPSRRDYKGTQGTETDNYNMPIMSGDNRSAVDEVERGVFDRKTSNVTTSAV